MPRWHSDLDLRLPHPRGGLDGGRGAGLHAGQRVRLRRAGAAGRACRSTRSRRGCSFFFNAHIDFFEEIAKYRAARRIWARWMRERYGADRRALDAAALPHPDRRACRSPRSSPRSTSSARPSRRWPACSAARRACTPTRWTRRWPCPPRRRPASRCAPSRCIAYETSVANVADPLGGSWFVEALTDEVERQAEEIFAHLDELGGGLDARGRHPRASRRTGSRARSPTRPTSSSASSTPAGASSSASTASPRATTTTQIDLLQITNEDEARQIKRLDAGPPRPRRRPPSTPRSPAWPPRPPTPRSTSCRR